MGLHKLTAGEGYTYLTGQVAANDATDRAFADLGAYYTEKGEAPGMWMGRGVASVPQFPNSGPVTEAHMRALFGAGRHPDADRIEHELRERGATDADVDRATRLGAPYRVYSQPAEFASRCAQAYRDVNVARQQPLSTPVDERDRWRIRTDLTRAMFTETHGREPLDARELSGHLARISRPATTAVAGYDLTFSPVKSVSVLWAIAPRDVAQQIERAHHDAVGDTLRWLEDNAIYTRRGRGGVAQVDVTGLVATAFTHRDSRAGDPDLHTHVAISNKVQALDGTWLALDGRQLYQANVAASERYNTRLEALLGDQLGIVFAERPDGEPGKRPVREIVGINGDLPRRWSARRADIDTRRAVLASKFQDDHGRPPNAKEAVALAQQATLETRAPKHEPRSHAEQRTTWRTEATAVVGGDEQLSAYVHTALHPPARRTVDVSPAWVEATARAVVATVQSTRATWQDHHLRAEAERRVRAENIALPAVDAAVDAVVARSISDCVTLTRPDLVDEPAALRRRDGTSVYVAAGSTRYTSAEVLEAERSILDAAAQRDGRTVARVHIDSAVAEAAGQGVPLNPGQVALVRELAGSGARVQLALAPAGTGKTTAMRVLSAAWQSDGGTVIGLAPSAAAASVLREELGTTTETLAKFNHSLRSDGAQPEWVRMCGPDTLVVIDEAGMAATTDLATTIRHVASSGGSVRLIGDDRQLAAIGAGGLLRDLADRHGAATLSQVLRFTHRETGAPHRAEGAASLALRAGDPAALGFYIDHGRVHVGDRATVMDNAYSAWTADRAAGLDALLLAPTREMVSQLNSRARDDRLATLGKPPEEAVRLGDGLQASVGDVVLTRRNDRSISSGSADWVKNGDRWTVQAVHPSGEMDVGQVRTGRRVRLPADYVSAHVVLGYAATVHTAQGITADICHTVATGQENRQVFYVAMTRGRFANHVHLQVIGDGDPHSLIARDAVLPPTAVDILTRMISRDAASTSATSARRDDAAPATELAAAAQRYSHSLLTAAEDHLGPAALRSIERAGEAALPGLSACDAWPSLRSHLALAAMEGDDPAGLLKTAIADPRGLADAHDAAAVLDWRIRPGTGRTEGPLPWLSSVPQALVSDETWGPYLLHRAELVTQGAAAVAADAGAWTATDAPPWATQISENASDPMLVGDLAVWRAAHGVDPAERRPTGPPQRPVAEAGVQQSLDDRVARSRGQQAGSPWKGLADQVHPLLSEDPYWPVLAERLAAANRAGIDVRALTLSCATERPLPDEQPAGALWWRLTEHLSAAALTATPESSRVPLRPDWVPALEAAVGAAAAKQVQRDRSWPALVASVDDGTRGNRWGAHELLGAAYELLSSGQPDDAPLQSAELTTALHWRVGLLTDPTGHTGASRPEREATRRPHVVRTMPVISPPPATPPSSTTAHRR